MDEYIKWANERVFPCNEDCGDAGGLSKRELFAAMAMQGTLAEEGMAIKPHNRATDAVRSVAMADALLAELAKPQEGESDG